MAKNQTQIQRLLADQSGATAVEYGLIAGLISVTIILIVGTTGGQIADIFADVAARLLAVVAAVSS